MTKNLNKLGSTPENQRKGFDNFSELNFKSVDVGKMKKAWTFFQLNLYTGFMLTDGPKCFYLRTESGNLYKILKREPNDLVDLTGSVPKAEEIMKLFPTERCIYNPQTKKIIAVQGDVIRCGEPFMYAPGCTTSAIKEIVGVSSAAYHSEPSLKSTIEQEFNKKIGR